MEAFEAYEMEWIWTPIPRSTEEGISSVLSQHVHNLGLMQIHLNMSCLNKLSAIMEMCSSFTSLEFIVGNTPE